MDLSARKLGAEFLGTAFLLAGVVGSGIMAERLADVAGTPSNIAVALLANAIATGTLLVVLIETLGPVSGAHFNPAVTLAMGLRKRISAMLGASYVLVQVIGAVVGVIAAHAMFGEPLWQSSAKPRTGPDQWFAEAVATFGLVFFIFLAVRVKPSAVAWVVGLYITAAYWFTASTSFANPAVTLARTLTDSFAGISPAHAPAFIFAQLAAAVLATAAAAAIEPED